MSWLTNVITRFICIRFATITWIWNIPGSKSHYLKMITQFTHNLFCNVRFSRYVQQMEISPESSSACLHWNWPQSGKLCQQGSWRPRDNPRWSPPTRTNLVLFVSKQINLIHGFKDPMKITLPSTILPLQLQNFVSCERDKPSHLTQNFVIAEAKFQTVESFRALSFVQFDKSSALLSFRDALSLYQMEGWRCCVEELSFSSLGECILEYISRINRSLQLLWFDVVQIYT